MAKKKDDSRRTSPTHDEWPGAQQVSCTVVQIRPQSEGRSRILGLQIHGPPVMHEIRDMVRYEVSPEELRKLAEDILQILDQS